jgi:hypothetical protein
LVIEVPLAVVIALGVWSWSEWKREVLEKAGSWGVGIYGSGMARRQFLEKIALVRLIGVREE